MTSHTFEHWSAGNTYEQFMGRWSREIASRFIGWLDAETQRTWLDIGCGTGALTQSIIAGTDPRAIIGLDPSLSFVQFARQQTDYAFFVVGDGTSLPLTANSFDAVVSGLALNFMPQPLTALTDMHRVTNPGGFVAAYVWDYADKMEFLRYFWDVAVELDPDAIAFHEGRRFPLCRPDKLLDLWRQASFKDVVVDVIDIPTRFDSFDDYWEPFTQGNFPAPNYLASLDEPQRVHLKDRVGKVLPVATDGSIELVGRVWAVRGTR